MGWIGGVLVALFGFTVVGLIVNSRGGSWLDEPNLLQSNGPWRYKSSGGVTWHVGFDPATKTWAALTSEKGGATLSRKSKDDLESAMDDWKGA